MKCACVAELPANLCPSLRSQGTWPWWSLCPHMESITTQWRWEWCLTHTEASPLNARLTFFSLPLIKHAAITLFYLLSLNSGLFSISSERGNRTLWLWWMRKQNAFNDFKGLKVWNPVIFFCRAGFNWFPQLSSRSATSTNFSRPAWLIQGVCKDQTVTLKWLSQSHTHLKELNGVIAPLFFFKLPLLKQALMSGGEVCVCVCLFTHVCVCVHVLSCRTSKSFRGGWEWATKASASTTSRTNSSPERLVDACVSCLAPPTPVSPSRLWVWSFLCWSLVVFSHPKCCLATLCAAAQISAVLR